jgi:tetratricopeptide (TPR) repeat protein
MKELSGKKALSEAEKQKMELLRELADKLKMTDEAEKALKELMDTQEYKDLQEALAELEMKMEEAQQKAGDEDRPLTQEEMEQIRQAAEQYQEALKKFAEDMKDPAKKEEMLQNMRDLMEQIKNGELNLEACRTCMSILPLPMGGAGLSQGSPSAGGLEGGVFQDTDRINKLGKPDPGTGKGIATRVRGVRDPKQGSESYIEVKAPTFSGTRSSVPYSQVLPQYRRQAERAIDRKQVPKADEAKVRRYFDSLTGARP